MLKREGTGTARGQFRWFLLGEDRRDVTIYELYNNLADM